MSAEGGTSDDTKGSSEAAIPYEQIVHDVHTLSESDKCNPQLLVKASSMFFSTQFESSFSCHPLAASHRWVEVSTLQNYDQIFRLIVTGNQNIGKTNFIGRLVDYFNGRRVYDRRDDSCFCSVDIFVHDPIVRVLGAGIDDEDAESVETSAKEEVKPVYMKLQLWELGASIRTSKTPLSHFYRTKDAIIVCFNVHDRDSFLKLSHHCEEVQRFAKAHASIVIVGLLTKDDANATRQVSSYEAKLFAEPRFPYLECNISHPSYKESDEDWWDTLATAVHHSHRQMAENNVHVRKNRRDHKPHQHSSLILLDLCTMS